ncbi:hypothetical protein TR2A62_2908 [Thalassobium sp. R2A62]|nr:hypothetical protein TR2A62_2908 [Thalassobium sp. R2A62]
MLRRWSTSVARATVSRKREDLLAPKPDPNHRITPVQEWAPS